MVAKGIGEILMRQGIMGGSFDPVHEGHVNLACEIMVAASLDSIRFIPAAVPPHKRDSILANSAHRVAMLELAIEGKPGLSVDTRELQRGGTSYTVETIRELLNEFPADEFFFIIGADSLGDLPKWYDIAELSKMVVFLVAARPGDDLASCSTTAERIAGLQFEVISTTPMDISSSGIRTELRGRDIVPDGLSPSVLSYIREKGLYA